MISKKFFNPIFFIPSAIFLMTLCFGLSGAIANDSQPVCPDLCGNNSQFTSEFRLQDCKYFKSVGKNTYFNLIPGFKSTFESEDEAAEITVLWDREWIDLRSQGLGWVKTRVVEERAYEKNEDEELLLTEISFNWIAICKKTNAVYYFGEDSNDCSLERGGFDPDDETKCLFPELEDSEEIGLLAVEEEDEDLDPDTAGSWRAGVDGARPGLLMPGTFLLGAKYFQELAPKGEEDVDDSACDRGQNEAMGLTADNPRGDKFTDCVEVADTNPVEGECAVVGENADIKIYCPGVGLVSDGDLELTEYGYDRLWHDH